MSFKSPILGPSGVGLVDSSGNLTSAARKAFVEQVGLLLVGGNRNGLGPKVSSLIGVTFPPVAGPKLFDPDLLLTKPQDPLGNLFWFEPSPTALLTLPVLADEQKDYQKVVVTNLYGSVVRMLNLNGNVVAPPLLDPTSFFPDLDSNIDIGDFLVDIGAALAVPLDAPTIAVKYSLDVDVFVKFIADLPGLASIPPIPPPLPDLPNVDLDFINLPDLFKAVFELPLLILRPSFVVDLIKVPSPDVPSIFGKILELLLGILLKALEVIGLLAILPKLLVATIIVILQNMVSMLVVDVIGLVLGTGLVCRTAAKLLGLV